MIFFSYILHIFLLLCPILLIGSSEGEFPVLFKGRFRPVEAYSRLLLYEFYHSESIKSKDKLAFQADSALEFVLKLDVLGHPIWDQAPLFWIGSKKLKKMAGFELKRDRFSYEEIKDAFYKNPKTSQKIFSYLITYEFLNASSKNGNITYPQKFELKNLMPGSRVRFQDSRLTLMSIPDNFSWDLIKKGEVFPLNPARAIKKFQLYQKNSEIILSLITALQKFENLSGIVSPGEKKFEEYFIDLKKRNLPPNEIARTLEKNYPLLQRLNSAGNLFYALPGNREGTWFPLNALGIQVYSIKEDRLIPIDNFTQYSSEQFNQIRQNYFTWVKAVSERNHRDEQKALTLLSTSLIEAYQKISGKKYNEANGKALYYPTLNQLKAESYYYQYSWITYLIILYTISAILLCFAYRLSDRLSFKLSLIFLGTSFAFHTVLLIWRSYLLSRPPVSNMFETVIYVPWVTMSGALILNYFKKNLPALIAASLSSVILLVLIEFTELNQSLDNVQAVLDSQFWLFIHVLLIVGSYGLFILGAILAHFYLGLLLFHKQETHTGRLISESILQSIYLGLVMLIPGTLLGGVWAAESWGRFWDWDPKESWAFISICIYLVWVHAYRYHKIGSFGLAIGAVSGLLAISFTWYGVNYILGTGLHSYGFGSGGEKAYYTFLLVETLFIIYMLNFRYRTSKEKLL